MAVKVQILIVVEAREAAEAERIVDFVAGRLSYPIAARGEVEEYPKFPDSWEGVLHLVPLDEKPLDVVERVTAELAAVDWLIVDRGGQADGTWNRGVSQAPVLAHPGVSWVNVWAYPPQDPNDEPAETEELIPDPPASDERVDWTALFREAGRLDEDPEGTSLP